MAEGNKFDLKIITPDQIFFEGKASMVEFNTTEGEIGIYKEHVPTTVIVAPGILTITDGEEQKEAALHAGFVEILQDKVTIMAEIVEWPHEIDLERAQQARQRAEERIAAKSSDIDVARAEVALRRAMARIGVKK